MIEKLVKQLRTEISSLKEDLDEQVSCNTEMVSREVKLMMDLKELRAELQETRTKWDNDKRVMRGLFLVLKENNIQISSTYLIDAMDRAENTMTEQQKENI